MCKLAQQLCGTHQRLAKVTIRYCEPVREKYPTLGKSITFHVQNSLFWSPMDCCEGLLFGAATCADGFCPCVRWAEGSASFPDADGPIEAGGEDLDTPLDDSDDSPVMEAEEYETAYEHFAHDSGYETGSEFVPDDDGYENDTHFFCRRRGVCCQRRRAVFWPGRGRRERR